MPLILGSLSSFVIFLLYPLLIAKRIVYEETYLEENLEGYRAYRQKVKYRLIPYIW
jgi:protein-S-isoprenylcysteine O-methyltransferase Ste14